MFGGVGAGADVAGEPGDVAEHEGSERQTSGRPRADGRNETSVLGVESQFTGTVTVARHTQVFRIADVGAKLISVIAGNLCDVVRELVLAFFFGQGAVALVRS